MIIYTLTACLALPIGCGGQSVTTGATTTFETSLYFVATDNDVVTVEYHPDDRPELAGLAGQIECGGLDKKASTLALVGYPQDNGGPFTLAATLIDGDDELDLFTWSGTLQANAKPLNLGQKDANVNPAAVERFEEILERNDPVYRIRYAFTSDAVQGAVVFEFVTVLRVSTPDGTCPAVIGG